MGRVPNGKPRCAGEGAGSWAECWKAHLGASGLAGQQAATDCTTEAREPSKMLRSHVGGFLVVAWRHQSVDAPAPKEPAGASTHTSRPNLLRAGPTQPPPKSRPNPFNHCTHLGRRHKRRPECIRHHHRMPLTKLSAHLGRLADHDLGQPKGGQQRAAGRLGRGAAHVCLEPPHCAWGEGKVEMSARKMQNECRIAANICLEPPHCASGKEPSE